MKRLALTAILLASCGHDLSWQYTLPAGLEGSTLIARVRAGGCSASEVRFEAPFVDGSAAPSVPRLGSGTYGIEIEAHDASCREIALGCTEVTLPRDGAVRVDALSVTPRPLCAALLCTAGVCAPSDAGTTPDDAGPMPDTGPPVDAAIDTGPGIDAGLPSECSTPSDCPCGGDACTDHRCVPPSAATHVSAGDTHSCAIADGGLYCWGSNDVGQLGVPYSATPLPPMRVGVSSGWTDLSTLSLFTLGLDGATVRGWGSNYTGQAGIDPSMANLFTPSAVTLGITANRVRAGGITAGVLDASGVLWAFGDNGHAEAFGAPTSSSVAPARVGTSTWQDVAFGTFFTCGIDSSSVLQCWGGDFSGQLGSANPCTDCGPVPVVVPSPSPTPWARVTLGDHTACAWDSVGALYCWGANTGDSAGACGVGTAAADAPEPTHVNGIQVAHVSLYDHACAVDRGGALWCWGPNTHGQLGDGTTTNRTRPTAIEPGTTWVNVDAGRLHTCAIRSEGGVYCWGNGADGAIGTTADHASPTRVCLPFG